MELNSDVLKTLRGLSSEAFATCPLSNSEYGEFLELVFDSFSVNPKKLATFELNLNSKRLGKTPILFSFFFFFFLFFNYLHLSGNSNLNIWNNKIHTYLFLRKIKQNISAVKRIDVRHVHASQ